MPVLKSLTVDHSPLTIDTFEMIHANVPSLESLCLMGVDLLESELPQNIQPALLMTRLDIWIYDDDHAPKTNWLRYIHKKYTNIMHFNFNVDVISYCRELKNIFSAEYPVLLQSVGPQLESLRLSPYLDRGYQSIRTLGAVNCRIKSMDMCLAEDMGGFDALAETSSFKYIENLDLSKVDIDLELHRLKEMSSLKTLTIYFDELEPLDIFGEDQTEEIQTYTERVTIDMNSFFRQLPSTLESVVIGMAFAKFDNEKIDENFDVKKLEFHHITPKGGRLDQFIWNHFPNVHSLALVDSFQSDERIMLPNCHFTLLQVSKYFTELNVRLITKDETRFFSTREQLKKARPDFKGHLVPVSESDIEDWPCMTIICASVEKLFISGIEACLKSDKVESQS
ncbi:hypothetical protein K501DRAFT_285595 [Backusella circina FSU 941]|nr:hypothetical protein K501DRAFT_285595 [Backusella circina FSU 941]